MIPSIQTRSDEKERKREKAGKKERRKNARHI